MKKIATHNSCTGERGYSYTKLFTLFSRCQNKTIEEQFNAGVRYFDIRIRITERGIVSAHGFWESERSIQSILRQLNDLAKNDSAPCYYSITYEGDLEYKHFKKYVDSWKGAYKNIILTFVAIKKPYWHIVETKNLVYCENCYTILNFSTWHTFLPIPWLWKKIYHNKVYFNKDSFKMVDFV